MKDSRYEEALERAKELHEAGNALTKSQMEIVFPALKESEDERIRKELIEYLTHRAEVTGFIDEDKDCKRWIAYLEKQKEQKPEVKDPFDDEQFCRGYEAGKHDAMREQKPAEWSEEEEKMFELLHTCVCRCINDDRFDYAEREQISRRLIPFIERLKSLRPQPKQKWSQEDNDFADDAIACVARCHEKYIDNKEFYQSLRHNTMDIKRWLIKVRKRLTPQWKPSKEQMKAILDAMIPATGNTLVYLNSLYEQLKAL